MSTTIDTRVVEMRFDNKQFEKETKTSLNTLEKLKAALNFSGSTKGLEQINKTAKNTNFDNLLSSVQNLEKRFSTMGIVGMQVIQNLTNALTGKFVAALTYVDDAIVQGGKRRAFNIENAHFQLQALLKDEVQVQAIMADANASVTDTAYAYDEAAKAASQFAATGMRAGEDMQRALKGITGVAAMTNSEYESISQIFTTVAGQGRLMGDQLLQLATRGLNAAATIKDFFNGVTSGAIETTDSVKEAIFLLTKGLSVTEADIRDFVSKGEISFNIFAEAMGNAFGDSAKRANETFNGALSNMKSALGRIGAEFYSPLIAQNSEVILLINSVKDRINEVKKALTFSEEIGNVNALSKQFTDFVLKTASGLRTWVENVDLQTPIRILYHLVESVKNSAKVLLQILQPIGIALRYTFSKSLGMENLEKLSEKLENFTSKIYISGKTADNLRRAFQGVFKVAKLLADIFIKLVGAIIPIGPEMSGLGGTIAEVAGKIGDLLTYFTNWVRKSPTFNKTFEILGKVVRVAVSAISTLIQGVVYLVKSFAELPIVQKALDKIQEFLSFLDSSISNNVDILVEKLRNFRDTMAVLIPEKLNQAFDAVGDAIKRLIKVFDSMDFSTPKKALESIREVLSDLFQTVAKNNGVASFVENLKIYLNNLKEAFTIEHLLDNIERFRSVVGGFVTWLHDILAPVIEDLNLGTFIAGGTGVGIVYALVKMAGSFESIAKVLGKFKAIPNFFNSMKGVMTAYQKDLNASALLKIAGAIAVLAGSLVLLSFANPDNLMVAATALSIIAGILLTGIVKLTDVMNRTKTLNDALNTVGKGLTRSLNNLAKAVKWKQIAKAFKNFGIAIGIIAASIIALAIMYNKDAAAMDSAIKLMGVIAGAMVGIIAVLSGLGQILPKGTEAMQKASSGILALSLSLGIVVLALSKLFKMQLPEDYQTKLMILAGIFGVLGLVTIAMEKFAGNKVTGATTILALTAMLYVTVQSLDKLFKMTLPNDWKEKLIILAAVFAGLVAVELALGAASNMAKGKVKGLGTILALTAMLYVTVQSLDKLMKMDLPEDWIVRLGIMALVFVALVAVIKALGEAGKNTGGALKATGTILAMCLAIATIVGALMVLQMIPGPKLLKGAVALGVVLLALGGALYGAGKIVNPQAYKSVLAMAVVVGSIVSALAILSLIPITKLAKSGTALGLMLLAIAQDFKAIGKIGNEKAWASILAMAGLVVAIAMSLNGLAEQPWDKLLAAGASLSGVLLAVAACFKIIGQSNPDLTAIGKFMLASVSLIGIVGSLAILANYPWQGLLAAGTAMSEVLLAFSTAFFIISKSNPNPIAMASFLVASASLLLVAASIAILADYPWQGLLAAGTAISKVLDSMSIAMGVCALVGNAAGPAIAGIGLLDLFIADLALVFTALGYIFKSEDMQLLLSGGIDTLIKIADGLASFVDTLIGGTLEKLSARLPAIGTNISNFMKNLEGFIEGAKKIDTQAMAGVSALAKTILTLTAADVVDGILSFFGGGTSSLTEFGKELSKFGPYIAEFADSIKGINSAQVAAASAATQMMASVAKGLPRSAEWVDKIFGTKQTLSDFGKELVKFGPAISSFAIVVKDVNPSAVEGAANAAKIMTEVADNLPNSGGLAAKIFGDNSLSDFGKELVKFGPSIAAFSLTVKDIKPEMVEGAANAAKMLSELASDLPNQGGLISWFTGDNTLSDFGDGLKALGTALKEFYESVSEIDMGNLSSSISQFDRLTQVAKGLDEIDVTGMTGFAYALELMGKNGITAFVDGFTNSMDRVETAINTMLGYVTEALDRGKANVTASGSSIGSELSMAIKNGFTFNQASMIIAVQVMLNKVVNTVQTALDGKKFSAIADDSMNALNRSILNKQPTLVSTATSTSSRIVESFTRNLTATRFSQLAQLAMNGLVSALQSGSYSAINAAYSLGNNIISTVSRIFSYDRMYWIGSNSSVGLANGIYSRVRDISDAAVYMAQTAIRATQNALKIHSPSQVFYWFGEMIDQGEANGILAFSGLITKALQKTASQAIDATEDSFAYISRYTSDILGDDWNPVLTPTMDLSGLQRDCDELTRMMNDAVGSTYVTASGLSPNIVGSAERRSMENAAMMDQLQTTFNGVNRPNGAVWNNNFNIQGEDPETIAQEVSDILQRQVEREEAVWA